MYYIPVGHIYIIHMFIVVIYTCAVSYAVPLYTHVCACASTLVALNVLMVQMQTELVSA
jgi:hypothetical protein